MITALITIYNPDSSVSGNILNIASQVDRVIVCDNSSQRSELDISALENAEYVYFGQNLALSLAFNKILMDKKYNWKSNEYILFFDQDSKIEAGHVMKLVDEYEKIREEYPIGCIGPLYYDRKTGIVRIPKVRTQINEHSYIVDSNITSSLLCEYKNLEKIQFWNEGIFLDMADWDLCWRFMEAGYTCFRTKCTILSHTVGDGEKRFGPVHIRRGAPIRVYYQTRNYLYLLKKSYVPLRYKVRFIYNLVIRPIEYLIFLDEKRDRFLYYLQGIRDYHRNLHGEYGKKCC